MVRVPAGGACESFVLEHPGQAEGAEGVAAGEGPWASLRLVIVGDADLALLGALLVFLGVEEEVRERRRR